MNHLIINTFICLLCLYTTSIYAQKQTKTNTTSTNETEGHIFYHTVERGQTVYSIATMYGISKEDIYRLNPDSKESIKSGSKLKIPQNKATSSNKDNYIYHTIQPKETLYRLSVIYNISAEDILNANPGLTTNTFNAGKNIRIPITSYPAGTVLEKKQKSGAKETTYVVEPKETLYRICRKLNISSNELIKYNPELKNGVKTGMILKIPVSKNSVSPITQVESQSEYEVNRLLSKKEEIKRLNIVKIALVLPFMTEDPASSSTTARFIEYYEGFLMAVDSLRGLGCSIDLSVYDIGTDTKKLQEVLKEPSLKNVDLIIGAVYDNQINLIANFSKTNHIKYVIPFTSKNDDVLTNPTVFQVNTPHSYLYANAAEAACHLFSGANVIFLKTGSKEQKTEFVKTLKSEMRQRNIHIKDLTYRESSLIPDLEKLIDPQKTNILIPTSSDMDILLKIKTPLRMYAESKPQYMLTLFGYPEWQTYTKECLEDFFALNTYIYSNFYADNISPSVQRFNARFKQWYSKLPINSFPKYGMLGYDTGLFFLKAINEYGSNFEKNLDKIQYKSVQTSFNFERVNNWGGFINTQVFIVHYKPDFTISRMEQP